MSGNIDRPFTIDRETVINSIHEALGVNRRPPNTWTRQEVQEMTGLSRHMVTKALNHMIDEGAVTPVDVLVSYNGRSCNVRGYQFGGKSVPPRGIGKSGS
jgi:hypothetical protein